jgi:hypothetical protein
VWYSFTTNTLPEESLVAIITNVTLIFRHQISILQGESCGTLQCVSWDNSDFVPAAAEWSPEAGVQYFILVQGEGDSRGQFELGLYPAGDAV